MDPPQLPELSPRETEEQTSRHYAGCVRTLPLLAVLLLAGCAQNIDFDWTWAPGDLHVHASGASNDTDGASSPEDIAEVARERGLSFVVLTDHSNSTGSMHCDDVEDCPNLGPEFTHSAAAAAQSDDSFVMVVGSEISPLSAGHIGCLPPEEGFHWDGAFVDRPEGEVQGADVLEQCRGLGGFAVVNHPFAPASWVAWDWTSHAYDAIEVWNGGLRWDSSDEQALHAWECAVARGQAVVPVAASDNHQARLEPPGDALNAPLGQPRTSVGLLPGTLLDWPALRRGLLAGQVVLHEEGSFVEARHLHWTRTSEAWTVSGRAPVPGRVELRRLARLEGEEACEPAEQGDPLHEVLWSFPVEGGFELETGEIEHDPEAPGLRYLALTRELVDSTMEGDIALTGLLELPP